MRSHFVAPVLATVLAAVFALMTGLFTLPATAFEGDDIGPAVGGPLPVALEAVGSDGSQQSFDSLKGEKGAVIVFFRSADWCPYCQSQLIDLNTIADQVADTGYQMIGISYDSPEKLAAFKARRAISFPLLSDKGSALIDAYGLRNPVYPEGHYAYGVPHPTVLVLDAAGTITAKFFETDYKIRPEKDVILDAIAD